MPTPDESVTDESTESDTEETEDTSTESEEQQEQEDPNAGAKKALVAERAARKTAEKELARVRAELASKDKSAEEQELDRVRSEATVEATSKANVRIVRAELKAAAAGKVKNPALALKLIDTSEIEVDDDGEPDADAISAAIDTLLTEYPELAADASKFGGSGDQGAKGRTSTPKQLTDSDLESMTPEQVNTARKSGQLDRLLGRK